MFDLMKKSILILILITLSSSQIFSQIRPISGEKPLLSRDGANTRTLNDTIKTGRSRVKVELSDKTHFTDYKIISHYNDTTFIDTTLSIKKEYTFNFLRKDNFGLLPFHNIGQTFNNLTYSFDNLSPIPEMGFRSKHFFYKNYDEVSYYNVPTPTSEIMFKTTLEQGQFLESFFTLNFNKRFNVSIAYTGLRSLGKYRRSLISQGYFRSTFSYATKEGQYSIRGHVATHDLLTEESGGLTPESLQNFIDDEPNFQDRARLDVNLLDTENLLKGSRFFVEHHFKLLSTKDTTRLKNYSNLKIGHQLLIEKKFNEFSQDRADSNFFGNTSISGKINNKTDFEFLRNRFSLEFNSKYVGKFQVYTDLTSYKFGFTEIFNLNHGSPKQILEGNAASIGANWKARVKNFGLKASGLLTPGGGRLSGNHIKGELFYKKDSVFSINAHLLLNSKTPNFNFLLLQSSYDDYNWENSFENIKTQDLGLSFLSKWGNASANFTRINNFTYFGNDSKPYQFGEDVIYLKVRLNNEIKLGKFALNNTLMYQNVSSGSSVLRVPSVVTRNTFYYSDYWFKEKPLLVNMGVTFKYFTKYKANNYNPLLSEFVLQDTDEIGFPTFDVFFNGQVRRTRIYFKVDNVLSKFMDKNYFSAPGYPYRDFTFRFGLVWNWFI